MESYTLKRLGTADLVKKKVSDSREANLFDRDWNDFRILQFSSCSSSLDMAWNLWAESELLPGDSVLCQEQTTGRGRMRREWISPRGNIYAAIYLPSPGDENADRLLSIIVGYCLVRTLREKKIDVSLKWPNDLILSDRKIGGLLIEERQGFLMCGIGLNLGTYPQEQGLRESRFMDAGSLREVWPGADPLAAWAALVPRVCFWYNKQLCDFSLFDFVREAEAYLLLMGQKIRVQTQEECKQGYLQGLDCLGGIVLDCGGKQEHIYSGHILKM